MKTLLRANWDRALAVTLVVAGVVALLLGWLGISGTGIAAEQNPYLISGGLLGIVLCMVGCTAWVSADLQDEWRRLDALEERLGELVAVSEQGTVDQPAVNGSEAQPAPRRRRAVAAK